jgi:hypothetical protein
MCDYSLMAIPNRLAVSGEELVFHRFEAGTVGLASALDLRRRQETPKPPKRGFWSSLKEFLDPAVTPSVPAVCVPPGARLLIQDIPANLQRECGIHKDVEEAVFTQITAAANSFRDAVRFPSGLPILLQRFGEGQRVRVLDVSCAEEQETASHGEPRVRI